MKKMLFVLLLGLIGGAVSMWLGVDQLRAQLGSGGIEARVLRETRHEDRLVLTLRTEDGDLLATFRNRTDDVDALLSVGDTIVLARRGPGVFVDDVPILRVRRPEPQGDGDTSTSEAIAEASEASASTDAAATEPATEGATPADTEAEPTAPSATEPPDAASAERVPAA